MFTFLLNTLFFFKTAAVLVSIAVKMFEAHTASTARLVDLLSRCFARVAFVKPVTSRPASSERYLICEDLKINAAVEGQEEGILTLESVRSALWALHDAQKSPECTQIDHRFDLHVVSYLQESNQRFSVAQLRACEDIIKASEDLHSAWSIDGRCSQTAVEKDDFLVGGNWWYRDPMGVVQGPFHGQIMCQWVFEGYFDESTLVCRSIERPDEGQFASLESALPNTQEIIDGTESPLGSSKRKKKTTRRRQWQGRSNAPPNKRTAVYSEDQGVHHNQVQGLFELWGLHENCI